MSIQSIKDFLRCNLPPRLLEPLFTLRYFGLPEPHRTARPDSLLSYTQLFFLQELAKRVEYAGLEGDFVECGVYRGGSAGVLGYEAMRSRFQRKLWLYDSFAGMPNASEDKDDEWSRSLAGKFVGDAGQTHRILQRLKVPPDRYEIVVGFYEETLSTVSSASVALLHVDCDFYDPVKLVLETFYPHVEPGGYIILNDYGGYKGCRLATNEFIGMLETPIALIQIDEAAYFFQKPSPSSGQMQESA